jgi:hypothetical protein
MHVTNRFSWAMAALMILLGGSALKAAPIPWVPPTAIPAGPGFDYGYENGANDVGLFGNPLATSTGLVFTPSAFNAIADGTTSTVSTSKTDRMQFILHMLNGKKLAAFSVTEQGDYSIIGTGTVSVTGGLFVHNNDTGEEHQVSLSTLPVMPISTTTSTSGTWTGSELIPLPGGWTNITVVMDNSTVAIAGPGSHAEIQKKLVDNPSIDIQFVIPEPATASLIAVFGMAALSRRRLIAA